MINRIFDCDLDELPSRLRLIACFGELYALHAGGDNEDDTPWAAILASAVMAAESQSSEMLAAAKALVINTSVPPAVTSTNVNSTPTVSSANTVSAVQASAPSVDSPTLSTSDEAHTIPVPTALTSHGPTDTLVAVSQANTNTELGPVVEEPADEESALALVPYEQSDIIADWTGTTEPIESAGMIIDGDFMQYESQETNLTSVRKPA